MISASSVRLQGEEPAKILTQLSGPVSGDHVKVTRDGIDAARWNPAGGEILIARLESIWSLPVATQPSLKVGTAVKLFDMPGMKRAVDSRPEFDIAPDGRILLLRFAELDLKRVQIHVIQNLPELLRQRAAAL